MSGSTCGWWPVQDMGSGHRWLPTPGRRSWVPYPPEDHAMQVETLIIGAGQAGLAAALGVARAV